MPQKISAPIIYDGEDQIICLPKGLEIESDDVVLTQVGHSLVLSPQEFDVEAWLKDLRENADSDFMLEGRSPQGEPEPRDQFD
jgi:virulence-associated protein VagC